MTKDVSPAPEPYGGPVIDTFLHTPWLGGDRDETPRGDVVDWLGDPRLRRVMHTFQHTDGEGRPAGRMSTPELLAAMDAQGVERALLPAKVYYASDEDGVRAVNRELGAMAAESGGRLRAVGTIVPPELGPASYWDVMQNVRLVRDSHREDGIVGIHITPSPWGMAPDDKWLYPVYATCAELGLAVFVHVGAPGPLWPMAQQDPAHLDAVALAFPELRIVAHHIGDPWNEMVVRLAARHPHFYICTSAWSPKSYPTALMQFLAGRWHRTLGSEKVIFASDFPLLDLARTTRDARRLPLDAVALRNVLHDNADRLFWS